MTLRPLPDMESLVVEHRCPVCGEPNGLSLKDIDATDGYECRHCQAAVHLSSETEAEVRDRITRKFADIIRLG